MENESLQLGEWPIKERKPRIHYIRYSKLRCARCKSQVTVSELGNETRCCGSFVEAVQ